MKKKYYSTLLLVLHATVMIGGSAWAGFDDGLVIVKDGDGIQTPGEQNAHQNLTVNKSGVLVLNLYLSTGGMICSDPESRCSESGVGSPLVSIELKKNDKHPDILSGSVEIAASYSKFNVFAWKRDETISLEIVQILNDSGSRNFVGQIVLSAGAMPSGKGEYTFAGVLNSKYKKSVYNDVLYVSF